MDVLLQEFRQARRSLLRRRGLTLTIVLTLALGIGGATASFVLLDAILLRPLPYQDPGRIVSVWLTYPDRRGQPGWDHGWISFPEFEDLWQKQTRFEEVALTSSSTLSLTGGNEPQRIEVGASSWNMFSILGTRPLIGRLFLPEDDQVGAPRTIVLSHALWRQHFGADAGILGKTVYLDESAGSTPYTVIGVLPSDFHFKIESFLVAQGHIDITIDGAPDLAAWIPVNVRSGIDRTQRGNHSFTLLGRLRPGVSPAMAEQEVYQIIPGTDHQNPHQARVVTRYEQETATSRGPVWVLFGVAGFLLLIACGNVGNLLFGEMISRRQEMAVRAALGANWRRLAGQLCCESALLSLAGGVLGVPIAIWAIRSMILLAPHQLPRFAEIAIDFRVIAWMTVAALIAAILFVLGPILALRRSGLENSLKNNYGGRSTGRSAFQNFVVIAEIALSFVLLVSAGLLTRTLVALSSVDPGFQSKDLLVVRASAPISKYRGLLPALYDDVRTKVRSLPGVVGVSQISIQPFGPGAQDNYIQIEGRPLAPGERGPLAFRRAILPNYFDVAGTAILYGRPFSDADNMATSDAAIVNRAFVQQIWPGENALGKHIQVDNRWRTIVGVVSDAKVQGLRQDSGIAFYLPILAGGTGQNTFVIRTAGNPLDLANSIKNAFWSVERDVTFDVFDTSDNLIAASLAEDRYRTLLISIFGSAAGLLSAFGLYSVISRSVAQRRRELGVRIAVGAAGREIVAMIIRQSLRLTVIGLSAGIAGALAATRVFSSILFGVTATNAPTFAGIAVLMLAIAVIASWKPARAATRVDPIQTLRAD
jgi:putative ABC transport system permease protein